MAEEVKTGAENVNIADLDFSKEFLEAKGLAADSAVAKEKVDALKREYEDFKAKQPSEGAGAADNAPKRNAETGEQRPAGDKEETNGEEVRLVSKDIQVDNQNTWIERYEAILKGYAEANNQEWKREEKNEDGTAVEGLKGSIGEGKFHFTAEDKAVVNAEGINAIVALAKETGQEIAFNEAWSDEFKAKMLAACEAQGVTLQGRPEGQKADENVSANTASRDEQTMAMQHVPGQGVFTLDENIARMRLKTALKSNELDKSITALKQAGAVLGNPDDKSARLALFEYAQAMRDNNTEKVEDLGNVLKKYGIESIKRNPDKAEGQIEVTTKDFKDYTPEEKAKIEESVQKLQPKAKEAEGVQRDSSQTVNQAAMAQETR